MVKSRILLVLLLIFPQNNCGTGIGNGITDPTSPTSAPSGDRIAGLDFTAPIDQYNASDSDDCGKFTENSTLAQVDAGRACIHEAFEDCVESKYLLDKTNADDSKFVSFVSIETIPGGDPTVCLIHVHTVSDVSSDPIGDAEASCYVLGPDEIPELACGIGN